MCVKMRRNDTKTTEIFPYIIDCMCLNISEKEALSYLKDKGFKIGPATYYRLKHEVKEFTHERLNLIASKEFLKLGKGNEYNEQCPHQKKLFVMLMFPIQ